MSTKARIILFPKISDIRGDLAIVENTDIPFNVRRVYYLYNVPAGSTRGGHAHKNLQQIIIALSGSFRVTVNDGAEESTFCLRDPQQGLYLERLVWRELDEFSQGAVCMVLASDEYLENDYIRDRADFFRAIKAEE